MFKPINADDDNMKITERDLEYLPRFWHSYSILADIAKAENMDIDDLVCSISWDLSVFNDKDISYCWFMVGNATLTSRLYDFCISEGIMIIEPGEAEELEFSLTNYGEYFKGLIDKDAKRRQKRLEQDRERRENRKEKFRFTFFSLACCLSLMVLGASIAILFIR